MKTEYKLGFCYFIVGSVSCGVGMVVNDLGKDGWVHIAVGFPCMLAGGFPSMDSRLETASLAPKRKAIHATAPSPSLPASAPDASTEHPQQSEAQQ